MLNDVLLYLDVHKLSVPGASKCLLLAQHITLLPFPCSVAHMHAFLDSGDIEINASLYYFTALIYCHIRSVASVSDM